MILKQKLVNTFEKLHYKINEKKYFVELDQCFGDFFPSHKFITENLRLIKQEDRKYQFVHNAIYLPFRTRDPEWLAAFIKDKINNSTEYQDLKNIPYNVIKSYVQNSPKFAARRKLYEQDMVNAYIQNWLESNSGDDFYMTQDTKNYMKNKSDFDKIFRDRVVNAIAFLGIDRETADLYVEENAGVWRRHVIQQAFTNSLYKDFSDVIIDSNQRVLLSANYPDDWRRYATKELSYMKLWTLLREKEYYKDHQEVVDKARTATMAMEFSDDKIAGIKKEIKKIRAEYRIMSENVKQIVQEIESKNQAQTK